MHQRVVKLVSFLNLAYVHMNMRQFRCDNQKACVTLDASDNTNLLMENLDDRFISQTASPGI